jgi:hypothetical protein
MNNQKILDWYQKEIDKDKIDLESNKNTYIKSIKSIDKDKIFKKEIKKISIWKRLLKVLTGI